MAVLCSRPWCRPPSLGTSTLSALTHQANIGLDGIQGLADGH